MLVVSVSLNDFDLLIIFTVLFVLSSWFLPSLSFVSFQCEFRSSSHGEAIVVSDWSNFSTIVALYHSFVVFWSRLPAVLWISLGYSYFISFGSQQILDRSAGSEWLSGGAFELGHVGQRPYAAEASPDL